MNMARLLNFLETAASTQDGLITGSASFDSSTQVVVNKIIDIGNMLLNIILILLGIFLIIKGAILGMQIVKAADEPQVRQEKIGSLKWLVIGCAIGFGITGVAKVLVGIIQNNLNLSGS